MVESMISYCGMVVILAPLSLLVVMGIASLFGLIFQERFIARMTQWTVLVGLVGLVTILAFMLLHGVRFIAVDIGDWVRLEEEAFHFHVKFIFDRLSIPFAILAFVLCGVVGAFAQRYLHREVGFRRFFLLYALFLAGMTFSALAGTIETLFLGWEMVGLSSALLVAYFHEREAPVVNGQRIWSIYRLADASFLIAALVMHHLTGKGDFGAFVGEHPWPDGTIELPAWQALLVGSLLLLAAAGKSALVPFSGWLPRAMEGPTPSSAIFYGSLSVHLGAYLLLRVSPILEASRVLQGFVIGVGVISAISGGLMSRVQSDVKSALAFASLTQVGIIVVEIGLGLYYLALIHIIGHACMRTLQLLRAPTLLTDYHALENAIGERLPQNGSEVTRRIPSRWKWWLYRFGLERGYLEVMLDRFAVEPFLFAFRWADRQERAWTDWLSSEPSRESDQTPLHPEAMLIEAKSNDLT